jgi:hypothetical protein
VLYQFWFLPCLFCGACSMFFPIPDNLFAV